MGGENERVRIITIILEAEDLTETAGGRSPGHCTILSSSATAPRRCPFLNNRRGFSLNLNEPVLIASQKVQLLNCP